MNSISLKTRAKLNLSLNVTGILPNKYHELDMVVMPVNLFDTVSLFKKETGINVDCSDVLLRNENNIVYKAATAIFKYMNFDKGIDIFINKNIWMQAGMGGGSSDAAAALLGINKLYDFKLTINDLIKIGIEISSDIPLFFCVGITRVRGIGEKIESYDYDEDLNILLLKNKKGLPTKSVFDLYDRNVCSILTDNDKLINQIKENDIKNISENMHNCLQNTAILLDDNIGMGLDRLKSYGAQAVMMTGSGSAVYGIFDDIDRAKDAMRRLKYIAEDIILTTTNRKYITYF